MGTDIHVAVEVRKADGWHRAFPDDEAKDPWCVQEAAAEPGETDWYKTRARVEWYRTRNYNAFAMLANVRNGRGFAGVLTGDGFVPIDDPRGWPSDLSAEVYALTEAENAARQAAALGCLSCRPPLPLSIFELCGGTPSFASLTCQRRLEYRPRP